MGAWPAQITPEPQAVWVGWIVEHMQSKLLATWSEPLSSWFELKRGVRWEDMGVSPRILGWERLPSLQTAWGGDSLVPSLLPLPSASASASPQPTAPPMFASPHPTTEQLSLLFLSLMEEDARPPPHSSPMSSVKRRDKLETVLIPPSLKRDRPSLGQGSPLLVRIRGVSGYKAIY